nr:ABC transporter permease [Streptomyces bathyalis]
MDERPSLDVPAADTREARPPATTRPPWWRRLSPGKLRAAVADARVVSTRNLRHFIRQPDLLVFSTIQPITFVLLFSYVFGGAISPSLPHGVTYINYLLPGILVQSVTFRASMTALGLSDDLKLGVIDRFRTMPMARSAVLVGRTAADLVRNVLIIGLMILIGYIIGFRFQAGVLQALGSILLVSAFGLALSWIFAFVALMVRSAEAAQSAGFVVLFPLVFASSVFVPVSSMPSWLEAFANVSPVTLTADAARSLALTPGVPSTLGGAIAWVAAILALFVPLSVWRYRRMT